MCWRVWNVEREGENYIILLKSKNFLKQASDIGRVLLIIREILGLILTITKMQAEFKKKKDSLSLYR